MTQSNAKSAKANKLNRISRQGAKTQRKKSRFP